MNKWEEIVHLEENRGSHTAVGIMNKGLVYVLGGGGMQSNLSSGEVFSIQTNKWFYSLIYYYKTPSYLLI